jgi:hypothetical protein
MKPQQPAMFETADPPLFSGTPQPGHAETFDPRPEARQIPLEIGMRVTFGATRQPATVAALWPAQEIAKLQVGQRAVMVNVNQVHAAERPTPPANGVAILVAKDLPDTYETSVVIMRDGVATYAIRHVAILTHARALEVARDEQRDHTTQDGQTPPILDYTGE